MRCDVLIVGTGIAGLNTALNIREDVQVVLITKSEIRECNSYLAQGGITTLINEGDIDSFKMDTLKAGNYKNKASSVDEVGKNAMDAIDNLLNIGVNFDRKDEALSYTREGGHSINRIVHVKDQTGKAVMETLIDKVKKRNNIKLLENTKLLDIIEANNSCIGGIIENSTKVESVYAKCIVIATGGVGGIFNATTNIEGLKGDGLEIALKHNVELEDLEYLQLHPTVLYEEGITGKRLLLSESLRGEGGVIKNQKGELFINSLLPRDVVSDAILKELEKTPDKPYVYLDMTGLDKRFLKNRFPYLYDECLKRGYKMESDLLPISPAHHYCMGGIKVNKYGQTSLDNLYAVGEVSCTGLHGSNRLASNSLLEALVYSKNIAEDINIKVVEIEAKEIKEEIAFGKMEYKGIVEYLKERVDYRYAKLFNS